MMKYTGKTLMKYKALALGSISVALLSATTMAGTVNSSAEALGACKSHLELNEDRERIQVKKIKKRGSYFELKMSSTINGSKERGICSVDRSSGEVSYSTN